MTRVSIIIPLSADDNTWRDLLARLTLPAEWEVLLAANIPPPDDWIMADNKKWLQTSRPGRGVQMNAAAEEAAGELLWFVHADSQLPHNFAAALTNADTAAPRVVHYFHLRFYDGGIKMRINELGVRLRCALFGNPFGDQALAIRRELFLHLGGYPESGAPGEDHLFVLRARRAGILARPVGAAVGTSARAYQTGGWLRTMRKYQNIWWRQWRQERAVRNE